MESIEQVFNGQADFNKRVSALISRNGDLINRVYLQATLPEVEVTSGSFRWIDDPGHHLIKQVEVEIGGQRIDRQYGDWLQIWSELTVTSGHRTGYKRMIGHGDPIDNGLYDDTSLQAFTGESKQATTIYVPLQFWFCRNVGLSLPLIALQYHEVKINLEFRRASEMYISGGTDYTLALDSASLWVDYIFVDTDERRRFAQVSHEYLIEQLQFTGDESISNSSTVSTDNYKLTFNHPVKELIWVVQHNDVVASGVNQWSNYTDVRADNDEASHTAPTSGDNPVVEAKLMLNGHDRFATRAGSYFNLVQCYQHHTNIPTSPGINVYSFGLKPEEHQPSGTVNMSRIDNTTLYLKIQYRDSSLTSVDAKLRVYCVNYNVLRIMSGMGGLAYSN